jgi:hypothetical protein
VAIINIKEKGRTMLKAVFQGTLWLMVSSLLVACGSLQNRLYSNTDAEDLKSAKGTLLIMMERNDNAEPFTTRLFVNKGYLHMSDTRSPADYMVFNRSEQTIYNVTSEDKTILVIRNKALNIQPPMALNYQEISQPSAAIPQVNGQQTTHYKFTANGEHCYDAVVMPDDFMPDVVAALREFRTVLAAEHATTVLNMPAELQDACDLSLNVFHPTQHMDHGLPIREWDRRGYQRFLKDYRENIPASEGTFDLPKGYERYSIGDVLTNSETSPENY